MTSSTPTGFGVIVLGDHDTGRRADMLADKAAEHGAVITEIRTFDPGQAGSHDDLAEVDAVVTALSRAICTKTDIWVPFPMPDLSREQHVRRLSLVLQRHGLNLLMGPGLWPCPTTGGMSEADFALRREVQAVDDLDHAALAAAGFQTLGKEIEVALAEAGTAQPTALPAYAHRPMEQLSKVLDQLELECGPRPGQCFPPQPQHGRSGSPLSSGTQRGLSTAADLPRPTLRSSSTHPVTVRRRVGSGSRRRCPR